MAYLLLVLISAAAVVGYYNPRLITDRFQTAEDGLEQADGIGEANDLQALAQVPNVEDFSLSAHAVIVVESDSFFTPEGTRAMRSIVDELAKTDFIESVLWMDQVPMLNIFGLPEPLLPHDSASPERFAAAKAKAMQHPFISGQLLSDDGRLLLILVNFDFLSIESDLDCITGLRKIAEQTAGRFPGVDLEFSVTGSLPIFITAMKSHQDNQFFYQIVGYGMITIMAVILFEESRLSRSLPWRLPSACSGLWA